LDPFWPFSGLFGPFWAFLGLTKHVVNPVFKGAIEIKVIIINIIIILHNLKMLIWLRSVLKWFPHLSSSSIKCGLKHWAEPEPDFWSSGLSSVIIWIHSVQSFIPLVALCSLWGFRFSSLCILVFISFSLGLSSVLVSGSGSELPSVPSCLLIPQYLACRSSPLQPLVPVLASCFCSVSSLHDLFFVLSPVCFHVVPVWWRCLLIKE